MDFRHFSPDPKRNQQIVKERMDEVKDTMIMLRAGEPLSYTNMSRHILRLGIVVILTALLTLGLYAQIATQETSLGESIKSTPLGQEHVFPDQAVMRSWAGGKDCSSSGISDFAFCK